ncbi:MAG: protein kinase, partial [Anaerolineales bacterium]
MPKRRKWLNRLIGKGDDSGKYIAPQEYGKSESEDLPTQFLEVEATGNQLSNVEDLNTVWDEGDQLESVTPQEAEADVPAIWRVGDTILDLYEVTDVHGQGGMGLVYKVHHKGWNVDLAVKSPRPEIFAKAGGKENFVREAETWVNLGLHPHTVSCYYVRTLGGIPRVFAEYVEGGSLSDWIRRGKLYEGDEKEVLERILDIAIQIAWGLDYAHEQGLVHQDVKPANVLMTPEGIAKVTDFGLSRARAMAGEAELPESEQSILVSRGGMTPAYCSPEQAAGKPLNRKTDIWSWGLSFLEMFTGEVTWLSGQAALEALESYLDIEPKNISIPLMPTELEELLRHCFQYEPTERPTPINEVASKLVKIYREIIGVSHPRVIPKPMKDLADNLNNRALSLLDLGEQEKAKRLWEEAIQTDPHHLHSTYNQGLHLWRTGHITDNVLIQRLEVARSSNKRDWLDKYMLGLVHLERGDIEVATPLFDEILKQAPDIRVVHEASNLAHSDQIASGCYLRTFKVHSQLPAIMRSVNLSADGRYGISGSTDHILRLWETANGRCLRTFEGHTGEVNSVYLSHDCRYALSGSKDNTLRYWKIANGRCLRTFKGHTDEVFSVCLSVDGRKALSGSNDGTMKLWQVSNGRCIRTFKGHTQRVLAVSISADGQYSLSGSFDKTLRLWETKTGRCLRIFEGHTGGVTSVCLSPDSRLALSGSADDTLRLWDVKTGHCLRVFKGHTGGVLSVSLSSDNLYALSSSFDFKIRFWETTAGRCLRTFEGHPNVLGLVFSVSMSSDGRFAMSGGGDQTIRFWRMPYGNVHTCTWILSKPQIQTIAQRYENRVNHLLSDLDKELDKENYVLALEIARKARAVPGYERAPQCLVAWDRLMHHCRRLGIRTTWRGLTFTGHKHYVASVFLSQNGRYALSGSRDNSLKLWEVSSGRCLRTFIGHTNWVIRLFLSADRRYILSCSYDCMKLWDVASGRCLQTFKEDTLEFFSVYLTTDCRYALSA